MRTAQERLKKFDDHMHMAKNPVIENSYPCQHVVISASHNKEKNPQVADQKILAKAKDDLKKKKECISYNFRRAHGQEVDENKFLMPLYKDVPVLAFTVIPAVLYGCDVAVVGSEEVRIVVEALNDHLKMLRKSQVRFSYEGNHTSLPQSILAGVDALGINEKTPFLFVAGDLPFFYHYAPLLLNEKMKDHVGVYCVNSKQHLFADGEIFIPRNFYHILVDEKGDQIDWKESNTPILTRKIPFLKAVATALYENRQGGAIGARQFIPLLFTSDKIGKFFRLPVPTILEAIRYAGQELLHRLGSQRKPRISRCALEEIASIIMGGPFAIEFGDDVWRMKDIDAWHDLFFYQHVIREAEKRLGGKYAGLSGILSDAEVITSFNTVMQDVKNSIGVLRDFYGYANTRARQQDRPLPYDSSGRLVVAPAPGENIGKSLEALVKYKRTDDFGRACFQRTRAVGRP